eukprot:403353592
MTDANEAFKKGEKALKTGVFKWSADYVEGAMYFHQAAKAYKALGIKDQARQAYLKFSHCSEKIDEFFGAAEGLAEAAFFEDDKQKSLQYLQQANNFFKIQGSANQGTNFLKKFAIKMTQSENEEHIRFGEEIFAMLFQEAFEEDNFIWNNDIIHEYVTILIKNKKYAEAIAAKKQLIKYLKSQGTIDHQIRRAYLEIVCIQIVAEDFYKIENTLNEFHETHQGNAYGQDEFTICSELNEAIQNNDFKQIEKICKKPVFSFIDLEVVKSLKRLAMNPPASMSGDYNQSQQQPGQKAPKEKILDSLML